MTARENFFMAQRAVNRQMFNPTCIRRRDFDGHIATAKNCGTHWVKYMLSLAFVEKYGLPPPAHIRDDSIIGHTKNRPAYSHIPQIAITHSQPHYLMRCPLTYKALKLPKFVALVRDIPAILVSIYEKVQGEYLDNIMSENNVTFSRYIRGDVTGRTRIEDAWGLILFFNSWGAVNHHCPDQCLIVRYEDLQADTLGTLRKICGHIGLDLDDGILSRAIAAASKSEMKARLDMHEAKSEKTVNLETRDYMKWFSEEDLYFIRQTCKKYLKYSFGYKIENI